MIALVFTEFKNNPEVEKVFKGVRPAVVALIAAPVFNMAKSAGVTWKNSWIPIIAALIIWKLGVSPIYIVIASIIGGSMYFVFRRRK